MELKKASTQTYGASPFCCITSQLISLNGCWQKSQYNLSANKAEIFPHQRLLVSSNSLDYGLSGWVIAKSKFMSVMSVSIKGCGTVCLIIYIQNQSIRPVQDASMPMSAYVLIMIKALFWSIQEFVEYIQPSVKFCQSVVMLRMEQYLFQFCPPIRTL